MQELAIVSRECPLISNNSLEKAMTLGEMSIMHSFPFNL